MPLFSYSARNEKGELFSGTIDALTIEDARGQLSVLSIVPEELVQISFDSSKGDDYTSMPLEQQHPEESQPSSPPPPPPPTAVSSEPAPEDDTQESRWFEDASVQPPVKKNTERKQYYPILDTLRLYAGWLLAWYALVYGLGYYQSTRQLSFEVPYLMGIYTSPLVLSFTLAAFLFLLMTSLHRLAGRGVGAGVFFTVLGVMAFVGYRMYV